MEIHMCDISYSVSREEVIRKIASILHAPPYTGLLPHRINFHIHLIKDKHGTKRHCGSGFLTVPYPNIGEQFLQDYDDSGIPPKHCILAQRRIKFSRARGKLRTDVVESLKRRPYLDPKAAEEKQEREAFIKTASDISIEAVQFGWECRDSIFSIEWEERPPDCAALRFDSERREIRIDIPHSSHSYIIAFRFSQINTISAHTYLSTEKILYFTLFTPPSFEEENHQWLLLPWEEASPDKRQRLTHLPFGDHIRVVPYTSLTLRLVCKSHADLNRFRELGRKAQLHSIRDYEIQIDRRGLFSASNVDRLSKWLRHFNWIVSFQIEAVTRSLFVDIQEMLELMPNIQEIISKHGKFYASSILRQFAARVKLLYWSPEEEQDASIFETFKIAEEEFAKSYKAPPLQPSDSSLFEALHVIVTPTTMFLEGPFPERSNRVIRTYDKEHQESFLRVSFNDEGRFQYRFDREIDGPAFIRAHVGKLLLEGLTIAGRTFKFLAYSQSALKEHAVWFVKPFRDRTHGKVTAASIIASLGSFDNLESDPKLMYCPARYAARLSQAFTATDASITVEVEEIINIEDICTEDKKWCFTDGVGTISKEMARDIWKTDKVIRRRARRVREMPRAYQVRFMGSKGVLSVDYKLSGRAVCLRPSMIKFEAPELRQIELAHTFDRPGPYFLNRPLIMLLEGLGVSYDVFKKYQDKAVEETHRSTESLEQFARMLDCHGLGTSYRLTSVLLGMAKLGMDNLDHDIFYENMLEYAINHVLRALKNHARIPIDKGYTLVGVADVHKYLKPGEIFACVKPIDGSRKYLEGPVLISRSPTNHPGDVQVATAIGRPPEGTCFFAEPLTNTVVFSVLGDRPLPSCLAGGDLDGDTYNLLPLKDVPDFRPTRTHPPGEYASAPRKTLERKCDMTDVAEFIMEYINSDVLGIIAINWMIIADQSDEGIFDPDCLTLSGLHSDAVDYPKSGQPVALTAIPRLKFKVKPDWSAPETVNPDFANYYQSDRAIGQLFRRIELPEIRRGSRSHKRPKREQTLDELSDAIDELELDDDHDNPLFLAVKLHISQFINEQERDEDLIQYTAQIFSRYKLELQSICAAHTLSTWSVLTEEEAIIGTIAQKCSQRRKRSDLISKLREQTDILVRGVREELEGDEDAPLEDFLRKAWLAWRLSIAERKIFGAQSFGWLALGAIFEALKRMEEEAMEEARSRGY
ncbi:RNA-directed RNA polymerase 2 [Infundibulicybe gibba]|nr:RNA-directed RNA polymerase 2 [Infundibulicybe gibba]